MNALYKLVFWIVSVTSYSDFNKYGDNDAVVRKFNRSVLYYVILNFKPNALVRSKLVLYKFKSAFLMNVFSRIVPDKYIPNYAFEI